MISQRQLIEFVLTEKSMIQYKTNLVKMAIILGLNTVFI